MHHLRKDMSGDPLDEYYRRRHEFLLEIARGVDNLIHERQSNIEHFRQQVAVFLKKCDSYLKGVESSEQNPPYLLAPVLPEQYRNELPSPQNDQDLLSDYYFLLTLIHDNVLTAPQFIPINNNIFSMETDWVKCCWEYYRPRAADGEEKALIETALERVKVDLASLKPAETGRNATPKSKIKDFFWTLYEKTLKVIVDAVMERWWPK